MVKWLGLWVSVFPSLYITSLLVNEGIACSVAALTHHHHDYITVAIHFPPSYSLCWMVWLLTNKEVSWWLREWTR